MKLIEQISVQLELFETGTGSLNSIQGQITKGDKGWVVTAEKYSKTFDSFDEDADAHEEIKEFLGRALHKDHTNVDYADDGEKYLFKRDIVEKEFK